MASLCDHLFFDSPEIEAVVNRLMRTGLLHCEVVLYRLMPRFPRVLSKYQNQSLVDIRCLFAVPRDHQY